MIKAFFPIYYCMYNDIMNLVLRGNEEINAVVHTPVWIKTQSHHNILRSKVFEYEFTTV